MQTVIYDENDPKSKQEILDALFDDEHDPRSNSYHRELVRPKIRWGSVACFFVLWLAVIFAVVFVLKTENVGVQWIIAAVLAVSLVYLIINSKKILITAIRIYQRFAPDAVRNKCRFEPSCSEYMILAVQKYGLPEGVRKGLDRLKRCNTDGGGYDYP